MTLWRPVLAALSDHRLDDATREEIIARGAAQLAIRRAPQEVPIEPRHLATLLSPRDAVGFCRAALTAPLSTSGGRPSWAASRLPPP